MYDGADASIAKWKGVTASELPTSQSFLNIIVIVIAGSPVPRDIDAIAVRFTMCGPREAAAQRKV